MTPASAGRWLALAFVAGLALLVAIRLGVFAPWAIVETADGPARVANGLAGVDHPFHAARAEVLRRSLLAGEIPRWIGNHQGGYPVEFYPLGAAWVAVAFWGLALGTLPIAWAHGAAVAAVLLLPGVGFWMLARRDAIPICCTALAVAIHVAVPGAWWHGGYTELVQWGLVTNVAGAAWAFLTLPLLLGWVRDGRGTWGALAIAVAAVALLTNPRSAFGLAVVGVAAVVACLVDGSPPRSGQSTTRRLAQSMLAGDAERGRDRRAGVALPDDGSPGAPTGAAPGMALARRQDHGHGMAGKAHAESMSARGGTPAKGAAQADSGTGGARWRPSWWAAGAGEGGPRSILGRAVVAGVGAGLLAAPELVALARFSDLYAFKHYGAYADAGAYLRSSVEAVSLPVFLMACLGAVAVWTRWGRNWLGTRTAALALVLHAGLTGVAIAGLLPVGQLEATRLMPLQRLLTVWMAAAALGLLLRWALAATARRRPTGSGGEVKTDRANWVVVGIPLLLSAGLLGWWLRPGGDPMPLPGPPSAPERGLFPIVRTGDDASFAELERAVRAADASAAPGTAILVLGSALSWHEQLWAPLWSDRPFFYDDWLWFWRTNHAGTPAYAFDRGHFYPDPERTLDPDYLQRHGIGAVVVTGHAAPVAAASPLLVGLDAGSSATYRAWTVREPTTILTIGDRNAADPTYGNGMIGGASVVAVRSEALARQAWFPRWDAAVDGVTARVGREADGTLRVLNVPPGARVELRYATDGWDWAARVMALGGVVVALAVARTGRSRQQPAILPAGAAREPGPTSAERADASA